MDLSREWYDCEPADYRRALDRMNSGKQTQILRYAQDDNAR
jgi:hypothetical protein